MASRRRFFAISMLFCRRDRFGNCAQFWNNEDVPRNDSVLQANGGEGGIRTHVPELPDHPISSRRRYDHFGTSPLT